MNLRSSALPLFVASSLGLAPALAQDLAFVDARLLNPVANTVAGTGVQVTSTVLAAGTDVLAGLGSSCQVDGGNAGVWGAFQVSDQSLWLQVSADAAVNGAVLSNGSASSGDPKIDVQLMLPRAMPVRFQLGGFTASNVGAQLGRVRIDIVATDGIDFEFEGQPGLCLGASEDLVVDLPAGPTVVRVELEASLPPGAAGTEWESVCASANVVITAARVTVDHEPGGCGASLELTPMLDGTHLRCQVGQWYWPTATWLVFGLEPTNVMLPLAPGCALLVDPQIVLPILPMAFTTLPIPNIGPIELKVQGVMLEPASGLLTSQRATLTVR